MIVNPERMRRNVALYPWHGLLHNLVFWQATWFLYFQNTLSAAEAILLYVIYDVSVTALEVPSGYMSDRLGRRITLIASALASALGLLILGVGNTLWVFIAGQFLVGVSAAFKSGTDNALLYQSLAALDQQKDIERHTLVAWRYGFVGLGLSALIGGGAALLSQSLPFVLSGFAMLGAFVCAFRFAEPPSDTQEGGSEWDRLRTLFGHFSAPPILWLFVLGMVMYGFSHLPFVFGQPFIAQTLAEWGMQSDAPLVSGTVSALMMGLSVLVSLVAPTLRQQLGLGVLLVLAFAIQVGLAAALSVFGTVFAIALLLLRMVPDSLSTPFIVAHLQPMLGDESRATFLSLKSFFGRLLFAGSLAIAAGSTTGVGVMPLADIQTILMWYAAAGVFLLFGFSVTVGVIARRNQA